MESQFPTLAYSSAKAAMAQIGADGPSAPTGGYFDRHGPIPW
jgi:hypothetical protein